MSDVDPSVLLVEDDEETARLYEEWLVGYDVDVANDGDAALERLSAATDVVLLDRRMPGISGDAVLEHVVDGDFDCRVAIVSGVEPDFDIVETGFDYYLQKPVSRQELETCVDSLLRRSAYSRDLQRYYALAEQRASLEATKPSSELRSNTVYQSVLDELDELEPRLDGYHQHFTHEDVRVALRDAVFGTPAAGD
jgi:DNA-binding response OmpR family regulator